MRFHLISLVLLSLAVAACTTEGSENAPPVAAVATYQGPQLQGRWGLYVDPGAPPSQYRSTTDTCSDNLYDFNAAQAIARSVEAAVKPAFANFGALPAPPTPASLSEAGFSRALFVRMLTANGELAWQDTFWSAESFATVRLAAQVEVMDARGGALATYWQEADGRSDAGSGGCTDPTDLLRQAYDRASRAVMAKILPQIATAQ